MGTAPNIVYQPENTILEALRGFQREVSLDDLLEKVHSMGQFENSEIKAAIWRLVSSSAVDVTSDDQIRLHIPSNGPNGKR